MDKREILFLLARRLRELMQVAGTVDDVRFAKVAEHLSHAADGIIDLMNEEQEP